MEKIANILFVISGCIFFIEGIPQIIKLLKRKSSSDLSLIFFSLCLIALILFEIAALLIKNMYLFFTNFLPLINVIVIITLALKYRIKND